MLISNSAVGCWTITRRAGKLKPPAVKQKIVRIGAGSFKIFQSRPEKGTDGLSFFPLEGQIEEADLSFGEKTAFQSRFFETAVSSLDFVYRKLRQTPEKPPKNDEIGQMDNRNQAR